TPYSTPHDCCNHVRWRGVRCTDTMPAPSMATAREEGAPIGKDEIDPDLVNLRGPAAKVGMVTAAAIVLLCAVMMYRMRHDLAFSRAGASAKTVSVADIVAGKIDDESFVTVEAPLDRDPAIRTP